MLLGGMMLPSGDRFQIYKNFYYFSYQTTHRFFKKTFTAFIRPKIGCVNFCSSKMKFVNTAGNSDWCR